MAPKWLTDYYDNQGRARDAQRRRTEERKREQRRKRRALARITNDLPSWMGDE
ncbi:MAG: hypothetical protein KAI66_27805 [Lentisphaeria bacterium]|nr:hypothetical protein [Lentisphaeria bacterium]